MLKKYKALKIVFIKKFKNIERPCKEPLNKLIKRKKFKNSWNNNKKCMDFVNSKTTN